MSHYKSSRNSGFRGSFSNWVRGGGLRPVVAIALLIAVFVALPDRNLTFRDALGASVPSTPSLGGCNINNHIASMSVSLTSDGGSPIINYEYHIATSKPASQPTQWTPFDPAQTSSPLTWDMRALGYSSGSYRWYVRAINVIGASTGSWLSNSDSSCGVSVTATAPAAPTSLSATAGSGSASISFTAGSSNGASITNYSYSTNGTTYTLLSPVDASSPVTIPGLTGGTSYTIYLKAINSVGSSSASASVSVTPLAAAPTVSSVSGTSGTAAGGTSITITGTNFLSGATVTVGGAACTSVTVVSSTSITCTTPAGTAGAQNIVVTNTDTQSATLSGGFTYIATPSTPSTPDLDSGSDSGSSSSDNVTSDSTPTISVGSVSNGNTVTVTATKAGSTSVTCTFTAAVGTTSCDLGTLSDGVWSITSKQTNSGIDSVASSALSLTIDTTLPTVSSFSSTTANGSYGVGTAINITATMSEAVADGASITVTLDTGDTVVLTKATSTTLTGTYTVGVGDTSSDLNVSSYVLTSAPADTAGNVMTSTTVPSGANNIAGAHAIVIDTAGPTLTSTSINSAGTQITLTYNEALHATSAAVGDFGVSIGLVAKTISSITISGSTVVLTISPAAAIGDIVTVVYTAPTSNSATSNSAVQDTVGNDAASSTSTATVTAAPATTVPAASGGSPSSATTTTTLPTTTTVPQTTTTVVPTVTTTTVAPRIRVTTTTAAPRTRVSTTTVAPRTSSTSSSSTTSTTVFRPMVPLAPVSTLPRATSTTSSTTTSTTTTTTSTTIARSTYVNLGSAEKALDSAKKLSSDSVVSAQLAVAELRLSVIDSKSAVVVAVRDAQKKVEKLKADKAADSEIAVAEQKVLDLKLAVAESKSISVEKILAAESALTSVLADSRSTAVQVANAVATLTEARTPSFDEAVAIVGTVTGDYTVPVVVPGVVDSAGSGNFVMLENDVQKVIELKRVNESVMVLSSSDGFKISIAAVDKDGNPFAFNSRGAVVVKHGNFIAIAGEGFAPGSVAKTWLFSSPRELGLVNVDAQGKFSAEFRIEQDVRIGDHISQVNGLSPGGETRSVNIDVEILPNVGPAPFDPLTQPRGVLTLVAELVALMGVMGVARRREEDEERESADVADVAVVFGGADVDRDVDRLAVLSVGVVDRVSVALPHRAVKVSPLLAGVFGDAVYLRALLGVFWLVLPIVGGVFGFGAASSTGFDAVMPSLWWLTALVVLGAFDALSGFVGALVFAVAVGVGGGLVSGDSVRGLLGVWVFCFAVPLIASATRPFRRARRDGEQTSWLRTVDFVLVVLFGAWVAGAMYSALPGLTGFNSPSAGFVTHIRVAVLVALVARFAFENLAVVATPVRLKSLVGQPLEQPIPGQELVSIFVRLAVYLFVAVVFIGNNWALWLGGLIYLVPKLVGLVSDKLPDFKPVHRFLPRGIFKVVLMLFVAKWWGGLIANQVDNPADMIKIGFVALGVPGLTLTAIGWFARSSRKWPSTILTKLLGTALLIIGVLVVLDIWAKI